VFSPGRPFPQLRGGAPPEPAPLIETPETLEVEPTEEGEGLLVYDACLRDCDMIEIDEDVATDSCLVTFHVWHLVRDLLDPDCCTHGVPDSVMFYIYPDGGEEEDYELESTGMEYGTGYSCYVHNYEKELSLLDEQGYYFRFAHENEEGCRCPRGGTDEDPEYEYVYVDCWEP